MLIVQKGRLILIGIGIAVAVAFGMALALSSQNSHGPVVTGTENGEGRHLEITLDEKLGVIDKPAP